MKTRLKNKQKLRRCLKNSPETRTSPKFALGAPPGTLALFPIIALKTDSKSKMVQKLCHCQKIDPKTRLSPKLKLGTALEMSTPINKWPLKWTRATKWFRNFDAAKKSSVKPDRVLNSSSGLRFKCHHQLLNGP